MRSDTVQSVKRMSSICLVAGLLVATVTGCSSALQPASDAPPSAVVVQEPESNNVLTDADIEAVIVKLWGSFGDELPFERERFFEVVRSLDSNDASFIYGGALNNSVDIDDIEVILMDHGLEFADWYPAGR